ncbi:uncharacterized protein B0T15DRAFT_317537 [Chaetomium strumarium]|uniref:Uncharacterized protein n=1 Tax=Chaetomium strumarium TaxID=1170767 RepID=A0AAJ0GKI0_9PEZI|nr:hypothetical protein B0T15DRAFT_317537 [Chaetomium strumarium]
MPFRRTQRCSRQPDRHPTLHHIWDFAMRSKYILSELDNIEGGFAVEHPEQIKDYDKSTAGTPNPAKAKELLSDVGGRSMTLDMVIDPPNPIMVAMMVMEPVDVAEEVKRKSKAVVEAVEQLDARANCKQ